MQKSSLEGHQKAEASKMAFFLQQIEGPANHPLWLRYERCGSSAAGPPCGLVVSSPNPSVANAEAA